MKFYGGASKGKRTEGSRKPAGKGRAEKPARKRRKLRTLLLTLLVIAAVGVAGYAALQTFWINPPEITPPAPPLDPDSSASPLPSGASPTSDSALRWRDDVYTVLLVGTYEDGNTDTIMFCTLDAKNHTLDVMSIPRDTSVDVKGKIRKVNSLYSAGGSGEKGMESLCANMDSLLGFQPHRYAMVQMTGFKRLVDAIGGVDFDVPINMYWFDGKTTINLKKGQQHLTGDKALQLVRFRRYGAENKAGVGHDDYGRMQMQQRFLKEVAKQALNLKNVIKLPEFVDIAAKNVKPTNLSSGEMAWFAGELLNIKSENIRFCTLPTVTSGADYYENVRPDEALAMINDTINPYATAVTKDMVNWAKHK